MELSIVITGVTPLLLNSFTDAAQMSATNGTRSSITGDKGTPMEQATTKLYRSGTDPNKIVIPQPNLLRCLIDAGKFFKAGKKQITTQKTTIVTSCLNMTAVEYPLQHVEPWTVDTRPVRIPSTGGRILAHRPCFNDWRISFDAELDTTVMSEKLFRELCDKAGSAIGLGDFRPDCKGPFGKFVVTQWVAKDLSKVKPAKSLVSTKSLVPA